MKSTHKNISTKQGKYKSGFSEVVPLTELPGSHDEERNRRQLPETAGWLHSGPPLNPTKQKQVWPRSWQLFRERPAEHSRPSGLSQGVIREWTGCWNRDVFTVLEGCWVLSCALWPMPPVLQARALGDKGLGDGQPWVRPASDGEAPFRQGSKFPRLSEPASLCVGPSTFSFPALVHQHGERLPRTLPGMRQTTAKLKLSVIF